MTNALDSWVHSHTLDARAYGITLCECQFGQTHELKLRVDFHQLDDLYSRL